MKRPVNFNWLIVLLASWAIPVYWAVSYLISLAFWLVPIGFLLPGFLAATNTVTGRRRRALLYSTLAIFLLGAGLDFGLGGQVLTFPGDYVLWIRDVPLEELLFYACAPIAIVLVYAWCDEHWLSAYNQNEVREHVLAKQPPLLNFSPHLFITALSLVAAAALIKWRMHGVITLPTYATFLTAAAFIPAASTYRAVQAFVNWRAFGVTTLYSIATSLVYEVTLAIPSGWWGYQQEATVGIKIERWGTPQQFFPVEAAVVWVAAPFACVLIFEFAKACLHHPAPTVRARLLAPRRP